MSRRRFVVHLKRAGRTAGLVGIPGRDAVLDEIGVILDEVWGDLEEVSLAAGTGAGSAELREASFQVFEALRLVGSVRQWAP